VRHLVWILPLALIFGGAIELIQPNFEREASWADFQADLLGIAAGAIFGLALRTLIKRYVAGPTHRYPGLELFDNSGAFAQEVADVFLKLQ
jgi:hypothetical protein